MCRITGVSRGVRGGRIRGQRGWVADRMDEGDTAELVEDFLLQLYAGASSDEEFRQLLRTLVPDFHPHPAAPFSDDTSKVSEEAGLTRRGAVATSDDVERVGHYR